MKKLRLLCLPGWRTNANILEIQLAGFLPQTEFEIQYDTIDGTFPATGPPDESIRTFFPNEKYFEWWDRNKDYTYVGVEETIDRIAEIMEKADPPYDGVLGFSQGGGLTSLLSAYCSLPGEDARFYKKFKFAILIAGFPPRDPALRPLYSDGGFPLPSIHIWGSADGLSTASASLARKFDQKSIQLHIHEGNHVVPKLQKGTEAYQNIHAFLKHYAMGSDNSWTNDL
eukprot:TRINITY_DN10149_c0_g1_i1.p1 TRINITY_DN10149_c0_g1~~TRINITY_DN10149_c0_g1_i1.p1  ORF type:complete len:227 (+),score=29.49 TRINITY_DN10149_c0_g1_i1:119-799(+)